MEFKCLTCQKTISKWYDVDHAEGDVLGRPWYIDEAGLKHLAIVCLHCGSIHDCSCPLLRGLLSAFRVPLKIHHDINPMELGLMIMHSTRDPSTDLRAFAIHEVGIPEQVIDVLVARKLLGWAFERPAVRKSRQLNKCRDASSSADRSTGSAGLELIDRHDPGSLSQSAGPLRTAHSMPATYVDFVLSMTTIWRIL